MRYDPRNFPPEHQTETPLGLFVPEVQHGKPAFRPVTLVNGINLVARADWEEIKSNPLNREHLIASIFALEADDSDLSRIEDEVVVFRVIKETHTLALINDWLKKETRPKVVEALRQKQTKLNA